MKIFISTAKVMLFTIPTKYLCKKMPDKAKKVHFICIKIQKEHYISEFFRTFATHYRPHTATYEQAFLHRDLRLSDERG